LTIGSDRVEFALGELLGNTDLPEITVALSIFKFDRMEWAIEKCTELGVARIIPMITGRTESRLAQAAPKRVDRWRRLAMQAAEQSRRSSPPEIAGQVKFKQLVDMAGETRILLSEVESESKLKDVVPPRSKSLLLAFGPEGGWKEEELTAFQEQRWISASLGNTVLRTETAVVAAVAIAMSVLS
jgi:16S rRNA (uracil1498-N3)-methyltransferase